MFIGCSRANSMPTAAALLHPRHRLLRPPVMKLVDRIGMGMMKSLAAQVWMLGGEFRVFVLQDVGIL